MCSLSASIQNGIFAISCACEPILFNGQWEVDSLPNLGNFTSSSTLGQICFGDECSEVTSGTLAAESLVCNGSWLSLPTLNSNLTFHLNQSCVSVSVSVVPGRVFSHPASIPLALSFLKSNYYLIKNNTFAVVTNVKGVTVGQIRSDLIQVSVQTFSSDHGIVFMLPCILLDPMIGVQDYVNYDTFDIGILLEDEVTIHPLGLSNTLNISGAGQMPMLCFSEISLQHNKTSFILIQRNAQYESTTAYTHAEYSIVMTSGALFCFGGVLVLLFNIVNPYNLGILVVGMQSVLLLLFCGVYFFVLASGDINIGGLLDFALVEIPTFIYIGIFFEIIISSYQFFFCHGESEKLSKTQIHIIILACLLLNWIVFAAIIIALALSNNTATITKTCDCQLSGEVQQSNVAEVIRLVYKSIVLLIANGVLGVTLSFRNQVLKAGGLQELYYQVILLSLGLLCDCIAFVVYYAVNTPSAYFLIVLWFTELLPICMMNGFVTWMTKDIQFNLG